MRALRCCRKHLPSSEAPELPLNPTVDDIPLLIGFRGLGFRDDINPALR